MARKNYGFDKRQRDLEKKRKQEEKLKRRLERREIAALGAGESDGGRDTADAVAPQPEDPTSTSLEGGRHGNP